MDYRILFKEDNDAVRERFDLAAERISRIPSDGTVAEPYRNYFERMSGFVTSIWALCQSVGRDEMTDMTLEQLEGLNEKLYCELIGEAYDQSYLNPRFAAARLGENYGALLSFLYTELQGMTVYACESRLWDMTVVMELLIEIYVHFEEESAPDLRSLKKAIYWYISDYSEVTVEYRLREQFDRDLDYIKAIIMTADLNDLRYLYRFGAYVGENELKTASYLNGLSKQQIDAMAHTYVDGYIRGFKTMGVPLENKQLVIIRTAMGFERVIRRSIELFEAMGLYVQIFRVAVNSINKRQAQNGFVSISPNPQYDYDHRKDQALYLDRALTQRLLSVTRMACEKYKTEMAAYAGPACLEVFGEEPFSPEMKLENLNLSPKQQKLSVEYAGQSSMLINEYIDPETTSFTIIAYPVPAVGEDFEAIFDEVIKVNTLDNELYRNIQQCMIDTLDGAAYVSIKGMPGKNSTDLYVALTALKDPEQETLFENCVADVNIPLGEVFTSPKLTGTTGTLNVSMVYLNGLNYKNLTLEFTDGMISDYICENFANEAENKAYVHENLLFNHEALPLGEFAIGTNTTAYVMAERYQIKDRLPILIMEKTGPHFALGDTCYSHSEDHKVYNLDGKEIIARENEYSIKRHQEPEKAYFNCHTDITIPYDEIGEITAVYPDGTRIPVLSKGRFVLAGTEKLNDAFNDEYFTY